MTMQDYVQQLLAHMGIEPQSIDFDFGDTYWVVQIMVDESDAGKMIGARGETIQALRQLLATSFAEELGDHRLIVNVNDYKDRREEKARELGIMAAEDAVEFQEPQHLPSSLSSNERRVIHQELQEFAGVYTQSEGEGSDRHLVVYPESMRGEEAHAPADSE